jgi:hypothetical protein
VLLVGDPAFEVDDAVIDSLVGDRLNRVDERGVTGGSSREAAGERDEHSVVMGSDVAVLGRDPGEVADVLGERGVSARDGRAETFTDMPTVLHVVSNGRDQHLRAPFEARRRIIAIAPEHPIRASPAWTHQHSQIGTACRAPRRHLILSRSPSTESPAAALATQGGSVAGG